MGADLDQIEERAYCMPAMWKDDHDEVAGQSTSAVHIRANHPTRSHDRSRPASC